MKKKKRIHISKTSVLVDYDICGILWQFENDRSSQQDWGYSWASRVLLYCRCLIWPQESIVNPEKDSFSKWSSWDLYVLLFPHCCQKAQDMMTMFIDVSTRQIINYLGFFLRSEKVTFITHNFEKYCEWYSRSRNIKMQAVIENSKARIFILLVLSGLKCLSFYITERCVLRKILLTKATLKKQRLGSFLLWVQERWGMLQRKFERLHSISTSKKNRNLVNKGSKPEKQEKAKSGRKKEK